MKNPIILSVLLTLLFSLNVHAQSNLSWRQHAKLAEQLHAKGQYADAAEHYRAAWKKKTKKTEYAYKAGECFYLVRDYRNAAESWQYVKDFSTEYPMIGLQYARSLKQSGDYEGASSELVNFLAKYQGIDKAKISEIVQNELRGCELAAQYAVKGADENISIEHLSSNINTPEIEFAPMPFGDEALYFSSTMGKRAEIYRSIKSGNVWSKAAPIENFPKIENSHFCNGSLTPDATRFYFTICNEVESWGGLSSQCALYVTRRLGKSWAQPEKLPDYLNEINATTTHPYVIHENNTEILYFASNRKGGMGGMDIWYTTREINSNANDFTLPINAGSKVNTIGDDITPYYNQVDNALYFASNGQVSIGGYDIFMAKGAKSKWEQPENLGTPVNSAADDFFFVKTTSGKGGFLVSNRLYEMEKMTTTDEDIFAFEYLVKEQRWVAKGEVYNKETKEVMKDVEVALYEIDVTGQTRFLDKIFSATGLYNFEVAPAKRYKLEVLKDGFFPKSYEFDTREYAEYDDFGAPIFLEPYYEGYQEEFVTSAADKNSVAGAAKTTGNQPTDITTGNRTVIPAAKKEVKDDYRKTYQKESEKSTVSDVAVVSDRREETESEASITRQPVKKEVYNPETGVNGKTEAGSGLEDSIAYPRAGKPYYKIQIIALSSFNPKQSRYNTVKQFGKLDTEFISDRNLYRVLIAGYESTEDAMKDLERVRKNRDFHDAFLVEYRDGQRVRDIH